MLSESIVMENRQHPACGTNAARRRRWLQFRLKWLLVFITVLAVPLSWLGWKLEQKRRERWAEQELEKFSLLIVHEHPDWHDPCYGKPTLLGWLMRMLGEDFFVHVHTVDCWYSRLDLPGPVLANKGISDDPPLTDAGLSYLRYLPKLRILSLGGAKVTDAGLSQLQSLPRLERLDVTGLRVSAGVVDKLQKALPRCRIVHDSQPK